MQNSTRRYGTILAFILVLLLPTTIEHFVYAQGELDILPWAKLLVHFVIPTLFVVWLLKASWKEAVAATFRTEKKPLGYAVLLGIVTGLAAVIAILGAYIVFEPLVSNSTIVSNLTSNGISKTMFPLVALWLILVNPLMEEFFWRGFVYQRGAQIFSSRMGQRIVLYGSGALFALHHTVIVQPWFNWWQFLLATVFLALAGIVFNLLYKHTGSIIPSLVAHFLADVAIAALGLILFGYIDTLN